MPVFEKISDVYKISVICLVIFSLTFFSLNPFTVLSQEAEVQTASSTEDTEEVVVEPYVADTASINDAFSSFVEDVATTTESVASTTVDIATSTTTTTSTTTATTTDDVSEDVSEDTEEATEEEDIVIEDEAVEEMPEEIVEYIPQPLLSSRKYNKEIVLDPNASHSCKAENFRIDMSNLSSLDTKVNISGEDSGIYEMEIGSLPSGIDVRFEDTKSYKLMPNISNSIVDIYIHTQSKAQKGDFTVPIIFTKNDNSRSSVICQINIVNQ